MFVTTRELPPRETADVDVTDDDEERNNADDDDDDGQVVAGLANNSANVGGTSDASSDRPILIALVVLVVVLILIGSCHHSDAQTHRRGAGDERRRNASPHCTAARTQRALGDEKFVAASHKQSLAESPQSQCFARHQTRFLCRRWPRQRRFQAA